MGNRPKEQLSASVLLTSDVRGLKKTCQSKIKNITGAILTDGLTSRSVIVMDFTSAFWWLPQL